LVRSLRQTVAYAFDRLIENDAELEPAGRINYVGKPVVQQLR
jgi:hypothetical protein